MANPRNQEKIDKVLHYRTMGLSYREIKKVTGYDFQEIYRVLRKYVVDPLAVDKSRLTVKG